MTRKQSPINTIWLGMIVSATVVAAFNGTLADVTIASFEAVETAVTLAIGLIGGMALWLGLIQVVEAAGGMSAIARLIRPVMIRLFPDVPAYHPAMSAMVLNMAANALGLGNAATPMGLKAMTELDKLNPDKGTATDAMILFLAINTSSVTLIPIGVITVRASSGADNPAAILLPTLLATVCSSLTAIIVSKLCARRQSISDLNPDLNSTEIVETDETEEPITEEQLENRHPPSKISQFIFISLIVAFSVAVIHQTTQTELQTIISTQTFEQLSDGIIPVLICGFLLFGYFKGIPVYETVTEGAKEGFQVAIRIIPFMVAIFVAIAMFRASGALDIIATVLSPLTTPIGLPTEALSMALIRPLSGSGAFGLMSEIVEKDPNSFLANLVSTMQGSTETTFYVIAVYFGSINITNTRYTLLAALAADAVGIISALIICHIIF
ncbi:MAG: nucleoside recognition domain-containing protein [Microcoleaceae cyanobacterium]